jgi:hypothetical protein
MINFYFIFHLFVLLIIIDHLVQLFSIAMIYLLYDLFIGRLILVNHEHLCNLQMLFMLGLALQRIVVTSA